VLWGQLPPAATMYEAVSVQLTAVDSVSSNSRADGPNTMTCDTPLEVKALSDRLSGRTLSDLNVMCNNHRWRIASCDLTRNAPPAVCIGCDDPCSFESRCALPVADGSTKYIFSSCDRASCAGVKGSQQGAIRLLSVSFKQRKPAPVIKSFATLVTKNAANISLALDKDGSVFCAQMSTPPTDSKSIIMQNFGSKSANNATFVVVTGLQPLTAYDIYCVTLSKDGSVMSMDTVVRNVISVQTLCCKTLTADVVLSSIFQQRSSLNAIKITLGTQPLAWQTFNISLSLYREQDVLEGKELVLIGGALSPERFSSASVFLKSGIMYSSIRPMSSGRYSLSIKLSGSAAADYEIEYPRGKYVSVLHSDKPMPAPVLQSATFSDDGTQVVASFDSWTDRASLN